MCQAGKVDFNRQHPLEKVEVVGEEVIINHRNNRVYPFPKLTLTTLHGQHQNYMPIAVDVPR